jgi:hypothetical protein
MSRRWRCCGSGYGGCPGNELLVRLLGLRALPKQLPQTNRVPWCKERFSAYPPNTHALAPFSASNKPRQSAQSSARPSRTIAYGQARCNACNACCCGKNLVQGGAPTLSTNMWESGDPPAYCFRWGSGLGVCAISPRGVWIGRKPGAGQIGCPGLRHTHSRNPWASISACSWSLLPVFGHVRYALTVIFCRNSEPRGKSRHAQCTRS